MRQAEYIDEVLRRYSLTIFACHFCSAHFVTCTWFANHLYETHGVRQETIVRFLGHDSVAPESGKPNRSTPTRKGR